MCERCFLCRSIVFCQTCNKCPTCCRRSACRGKAPELLENLSGSGCQSESSSNPKRGLHPPLSDPAELGKVTNRHKLLCQSSQEPLPVGVITSVYEQKCSGTSTKSKISGLLQPTFLGSQAKQSLETYWRLEQIKSFPQGRKIQNGDTGNYQDIPLKRGVGYLNRLQGCLLPHTDTGTIQEISEISHPGLDILVQGTAIRIVHSTHGIHCGSKGGEIDGHSQGYKDPPIPRRLVFESQIPPSLSPAYSGTSKDLSETGLASERRETRAGSQASLRLRRLLVQPQVWSGPTDTGPVAEPSTKKIQTLLSQLACPVRQFI